MSQKVSENLPINMLFTCTLKYMYIRRWNSNPRKCAFRSHLRQVLMPGTWKSMDFDGWSMKSMDFDAWSMRIHGFWCLGHANQWISIDFHLFFIDLEGSWEGRKFWVLRVLRVLRVFVSHPAALLYTILTADGHWTDGRWTMDDCRWPIADGR